MLDVRGEISKDLPFLQGALRPKVLAGFKGQIERKTVLRIDVNNGNILINKVLCNMAAYC